MRIYLCYLRGECVTTLLFALFLLGCAYIMIAIFPSITQIQMMEDYFDAIPDFMKAFIGQDIIDITRQVLPDEGVLFAETGVFVCMLEHLWPVTRPATFYGTSGGRTMGLMLPAILGAKLAKPELPMIGMGADGSLLMRLGELEVFSRTGAAVPLVILNDQALGTMKSRQRSRRIPEYALDLAPVDFAAVARACGLLGQTAHTPEEFEQFLRDAMHADRTTLIDARVDPRPYQDSFGPTIGLLD